MIISDTNNNNQNQPVLAIIGGGFSGSLVAVNIARIATQPITIKLIEKGLKIGRGLAYNTSVCCHLLNVPAGKISAFPDQSDHFLNWLYDNGYQKITPFSFISRETYGIYIEATLKEIQKNHNVTLEIITQDEAIALEKTPNEAKILLQSGKTLTVHKVILALGNPLPNLPTPLENYQEYLKNPWKPEVFTNLNSDDSVLLVGTGLTMVDVAISLFQQKFKGQIYAISRHGLKPLAHKPNKYYPLFINLENTPKTIRGLCNLVRQEINLALAQGQDWRSVIDALRPITQQLWQRLPLKEKQRFLRHGKVYWEAHRHRIAFEIAEKFNLLTDSGQLKYYTGRIKECKKINNQLAVTIQARGTLKEDILLVNSIFNCTGSSGNYENYPVVINLQKQGLIRIHPLLLGFETANNGAIIDKKGNPSSWLYTLGSPRKGDLWETTAIPEIRVQAFDLAQEILNHFSIIPL